MTEHNGDWTPRFEVERLGWAVWVVWLVVPGGRLEQRTFIFGRRAERWARRASLNAWGDQHG